MKGLFHLVGGVFHLFCFYISEREMPGDLTSRSNFSRQQKKDWDSAVETEMLLEINSFKSHPVTWRQKAPRGKLLLVRPMLC